MNIEKRLKDLNLGTMSEGKYLYNIKNIDYK